MAITFDPASSVARATEGDLGPTTCPDHTGPDAQPAPRLELGFLTRLEVGEDAADSYRFALEMFEAADALGYDVGWIAQHHFLNGAGRLPSPFPFLGAAAERTRRIQLGTAIVTVPLEDPLRLAEDAAVVDALSGGRLQLGLGTGGDPLTFAAFGKDVEARRTAHADGLQIVGDALVGRPVNGTSAVMYPLAPTLPDRMWEATFSVEGGGRIGEHGNGLLLSRTSATSGDPADIVQEPIAQRYLERLALTGRPPRIGMSRTVYVAADRATAMDHMDAGVAAWAQVLIGRGAFPIGLDREATYGRMHVHLGGVEDVIESVRADRLFPYATQLICQVQPGSPTKAQILASLERIAREVAPALGWRPAH